MPGPQVKGVVFRSSQTTLVELYGEATFAEILRRLPADLGAALRAQVIFTGNWYPIEWYRALFATAREVTGLGLELPYAVSRANVTKDLGTVYRIFLAVVAPDYVLARTARLFDTYYDTGAMTVLERRAGYARGQCTGCVGFDANLWSNLLGGSEGVLVAAGARELKLTVLSGGKDGDTEMTFEGTWR